MRAIRLLIAMAGWWLWLGPASGAAAVVEVFAGIAPQAYLVKRIGGDLARVHTLLSPGRDPHTFEPTPGQVMALGRAMIYFSTDLPFERTLLGKIRAGRASLAIIDTTAGIGKLPMPEGHDHDHGPASAPASAPASNRSAAHEGEELDPHVWLAPPLLKSMAEQVLAGLLALPGLTPEQAASCRRNHAALADELDQLHGQLAAQLAPLAGQTFYVYHAAFGYFADTYGLRQEGVETGGKAPTPKQLLALINNAKQDGVRVIFVQPQFDRKSAVAVARAINGRVVPLDPLAEDVPANLREMATQIRAALGAAP